MDHSAAGSVMALLADDGLRNRPPIHLPGDLGAIVVGGMFLLHVAIGSFSMGAVTIAPIAETIALRRGSIRAERLARGMGSVLTKVFSLGATLGAFGVIWLTTLYPTLMVSLIRVFTWTALLGFGSFFAIALLLVTWYYRWDHFSRRVHVALGYAAALLLWCYLAVVVAFGSFMLTPSFGGAPIGAALNPTFVPVFLYEGLASLMVAGALLAAVAAVRAAQDDDDAYWTWALDVGLRIAAAAAALLIPVSLLWAGVLALSQPSALRELGHGPAFRTILLALAFTAALGVALLRAWRARARGGPVLASTRTTTVAAAVLALLVYLTGGTVREMARGPYDVYGYMKPGEAIQPYESPRPPFP